MHVVVMAEEKNMFWLFVYICLVSWTKISLVSLYCM